FADQSGSRQFRACCLGDRRLRWLEQRLHDFFEPSRLPMLKDHDSERVSDSEAEQKETGDPERPFETAHDPVPRRTAAAVDTNTVREGDHPFGSKKMTGLVDRPSGHGRELCALLSWHLSAPPFGPAPDDHECIWREFAGRNDAHPDADS